MNLHLFGVILGQFKPFVNLQFNGLSIFSRKLYEGENFSEYQQLQLIRLRGNFAKNLSCVKTSVSVKKYHRSDILKKKKKSGKRSHEELTFLLWLLAFFVPPKD